MIKVWVLVFYMGVSGHQAKAGGPMVIDNIATKEECARVHKLLGEWSYGKGGQCIEVWKVKQ